ncbi:hypothetical protein PF010_g28462, partial [Phytophthora fragariae]
PDDTVTETSVTDDTRDDLNVLDDPKDTDGLDDLADNILKASANDTEPEPDADAEADSAWMISATDSEPDTGADPGRWTKAGVSVGRRPAELCALATTATLTQSNFSHAIF